MLGLRKGLLVSVGLAGVLGLAVAPNASAAGTGVIAGGGGISPGLTTTPTNQNFSFTGTLVAAAVPGAGVYTCNISGASSAPETVATGGGSASGGCSGSAGSFNFNGSYTRAGGAVTGAGSASGAIAGTVVCGLSFAATSAPTVVSYEVAGSCSIA